MCQYLPGTPPLPDVPIPGNFNVYITEDDHPEIVWTHYYVHEYRIERKIGRGEDIRTLTRGRMKPGMQQVEWDGTDQADRRVASGLYIYQIIAGEFRQAQKMTLAY